MAKKTTTPANDYKTIIVGTTKYRLLTFEKHWTVEHEIEAESILQTYKDFATKAAQKVTEGGEIENSFDLFKITPDIKSQLTLMALIYQEHNGGLNTIAERKDAFKKMLPAERSKARMGMRDFFNSIGKYVLEDFQIYTPPTPQDKTMTQE